MGKIGGKNNFLVMGFLLKVDLDAPLLKSNIVGEVFHQI
jgi:hypothetical protein